MQRIAKEDQTFESHTVIGGCHLGSDSPSHRFAPDDQAIRRQFLMTLRCFYNGGVARFQFRFLIGSAAAPFHIEEIERDYIKATVGQATREQAHEGMQLVGARAMSKYQSNPRTIALWRRVKEGGNAVALANLNSEFFGVCRHYFKLQT